MNELIKVLFIGDIVGRPGRNIVRDYLGALGVNTENNPYDFIIANVENASHGFGLTERTWRNRYKLFYLGQPYLG